MSYTTTYTQGEHPVTTMTAKRLEARSTAEIVQWIREFLGLTYKQVGQITGTTTRTAQRWGNPSELSVPAEPHRARLQQLREVQRLLGVVFADPSAGHDWLFSAVPALHGQRPIDLIRGGEVAAVTGILAGLHAGTFG